MDGGLDHRILQYWSGPIYLFCLVCDLWYSNGVRRPPPLYNKSFQLLLPKQDRQWPLQRIESRRSICFHYGGLFSWNSSLLREGQPLRALVSWKVVPSQVTFSKSLSISKQVPVFTDDSEGHLVEVGIRSSERAQAAQEDPDRAHGAPQTFNLATFNA